METLQKRKSLLIWRFKRVRNALVNHAWARNTAKSLASQIHPAGISTASSFFPSHNVNGIRSYCTKTCRKHEFLLRSRLCSLFMGFSQFTLHLLRLLRHRMYVSNGTRFWHILQVDAAQAAFDNGKRPPKTSPRSLRILLRQLVRSSQGLDGPRV